MASPTPPPASDAGAQHPLPRALQRAYYLFPIILYVPDMLFNFYVYSDGSGLDTHTFTLASLPGYLLWGFLSAGIVGMAWLCSVLAPWHWIRRHRFQAVMCWLGVLVATAITIWNSLAYRSQKFVSFKTDSWLGLGANGFSLTMILVSVSPPFWGLFWAIVQPAIAKPTAQDAEMDHALKLQRLQQEAEYKRLRAEANATIRAAQLQGIAATVRQARAQMTGKTGEEPVSPPADIQETSPVPEADSMPVGLARADSIATAKTPDIRDLVGKRAPRSRKAPTPQPAEALS